MSLMPTNGSDDAAEAVDGEVAAQHRGGGRGGVLHAAQGQGDQRDDDERVEDHRREDGRLGAGQPHDVELVQAAVHAGEHGRDDREVLRDVVGDGEGRQGAAGDEQLLADLDDLDELGRVGVEVDHVAGLLGRRRARVHRHAHVCLGQCRGVVGAVPGHRDEPPAILLLADQRHLVLGRGLGEEVVDARLLGDGAGGHGVVPGDHDGADAHAAHLFEAFAHALLDDVLEVDDAQSACLSVDGLRDDERRAAAGGDGIDDRADLGGGVATVVAHPLHHGRCRPLADLSAVREVDPRHPGLGREGHELSGGKLARGAFAQTVISLGQHHDRAALRGLVGEAGQLCRIRQRGVGATGDGDELGGLAVAQGDRAGLVQQQGVHVTSGLHGASGHGQHVVLHEPVHAGDADGRQERTDGGRDQADQERDEDDDGLLGAGEDREGLKRGRGREEDDGQAREQDVERDLVGCLLPAGALDQSDHPVDEALARVGGDLDDDAVGEHLGPAGDRAAVAARLPDDRGRLAGDRRLVDAGHALDDVTVAGDGLACDDHDPVPDLQLRRRDLRPVDQVRGRLGLGLPERGGLCLPAPLGHCLREVGEHHGQPEPDDDRPGEDAGVGDGEHG